MELQGPPWIKYGETYSLCRVEISSTSLKFLVIVTYIETLTHFAVVSIEKKLSRVFYNHQNFLSSSSFNQGIKVNMRKYQVLFYTTVQ